MSEAKRKIADISQWLGADAFTYLTIMEIFTLAEQENSEVAKQMTETLNEFHRLCRNIKAKS